MVIYHSQMRMFCNLAVEIALVAGAATAQPVISSGGILNAASYSLSGLPNSGIAQGSIFIAYGTGLGPAVPVAASESEFPISTTLGGSTGISATITSSQVTAAVPLLYGSSNSIVGVVPSKIPVGNGTLTVTFNGRTSVPVTFRVVNNSVGLFSKYTNGIGPGILQNVSPTGAVSDNTVINPARPGQPMILWGTGLGPIDKDDSLGVVVGTINSNTEVYVGNKSVPVIYAGRSGCCVGKDQIVFTVPDDSADACHVPVVVKTSDGAKSVTSNYVSMAIARGGGACDAGTAAIQTAGAVKFGQISLTRIITEVSLFGTFLFTSDTASASFGKYDLARYTASQGNYEVGYCTSYLFKGTDYLGGADAVAADVLDAGAALNITGPKGAKKLNKGSDGSYFLQLAGAPLPGGTSAGPDYLDAGTYTIDNGTGGTGANAVGPFTATITLPPTALKWENKDSVKVIDRSQNLEVTWSGGDPNGFVNIVGGSALSTFGAAFVCREKTSAGRFTIPSVAMLNIPLGDLSVLSVGGISPVKFTAAGLDTGTLTSYGNSAKTVTFQ